MAKIFLVSLYIFFNILTSYSMAGETGNHVDVYYFLTDYRCASCHKIENFTKEAINDNFKDDLNSGKLTYQSINIDKNENKHFINKYQLFTKSVVLSLKQGGKETKSKNLSKVWEYLGNEAKFKNYITSETSSFLKEL